MVRRGSKVKALLDTGSLAGDFVSSRLIDREQLSFFVQSRNSRSVCSGLNSTCLMLDKSIPLMIFFS